MGDYLLKQPIHGGPPAEEIIREDRDARGLVAMYLDSAIIVKADSLHAKRQRLV